MKKARYIGNSLGESTESKKKKERNKERKKNAEKVNLIMWNFIWLFLGYTRI